MAEKEEIADLLKKSENVNAKLREEMSSKSN
jgi:hypothetical protein